MYAAADQSADYIFQLYLTAGQHTQSVLTELGLDAPAIVTWWSDTSRHTNLRHLSVHVITETARHLGHIDIMREQIDGKAGLLQRADNLPDAGDEDWAGHRAHLQSIAESFR